MGLNWRKIGSIFNPAAQSAIAEATVADARREWLTGLVHQIGSRVAADHGHKTGKHSRSFEAAETPAWVASWPSHASPINDDLNRQLPILRARARALARDNEWANNYLIKLDDNVLGVAGIVLQMRLKKRNGKADDDTNDAIEQAWYQWGRRADVSGHSWRTVESLALGALPRDGEIIIRLVQGGGVHGFQIQLLPADALDTTLRRDVGGNRIRMGVEIDDNGMPQAYWLRAQKVGDEYPNITTVGKHVRVPAKDIIHAFLPAEIGQLRGVPWLSTGARRLWMLQDFEQAAAVASNNAAKRVGFFVSPSGDAPTGFADTIVSQALEIAKAAGKELTTDEIDTLLAQAEKYNSTVPGQYDTLPTGYDFRAFDSKWPNVSAEGYVKQHLRGWSAARGMSYVSLGNDLEGVNYSSARVGILEEREHYKTVQALLVSWVHERVFEAWLPYGLLAAGLSLGLDQQKLLYAANWQPRRWAGIDPVKEANAAEINLRLKLTSRRRIILERGEDPDELFKEIEDEIKELGEVPAKNEPMAGSADASADDSDDAADDSGNDDGDEPTPKKGGKNAKD